MKRIYVEEYNNLKMEQVEIPQCGDHQLLIKVMAAGVNPVYTYQVSGNYGKALPFVPGGDYAGVVVAVGALVLGFNVGDHVFGSEPTGAYAQFIVVDAEFVYRLPGNVSFSEGAGLVVPYGTALHGILHFHKIEPNQMILVHGGSGGVGIATLQLLKRYSNITVIATAGTEEGRNLALGNGAHVVFDHRKEGYMQQIMDYTQGVGVDLIFEMLANVNLSQDLKILNRYGKVIVIGNRGTIEINPRDLMSRRASVTGLAFGLCTKEEKAEIMSDLYQSLESGAISPFVSAEYQLEEAEQAHLDIINPPSGATGKIVILPWGTE